MPCKLLGAFYYSTLQLANNKGPKQNALQAPLNSFIERKIAFYHLRRKLKIFAGL